MQLVHDAIIPRLSTIGVLIGLAITSISCAHSPKSENPLSVQLDGTSLQYFRNLPSVPGRFLITIADPDELKVKGISRSYAYALESDGELKRLKVLESRYRELKILDLKPVGDGLYGYDACDLGESKCTSASIRFMNREGHEVDLAPVPDETSDLNFHDFLRLPNGHFLFLFATFDLRAKTNANRIQEWDEKGRPIFEWKGDDHLTEFGVAGLPHINSIDVDPDGDIVISIPQLNTLYKIDRPSGKILARISSAEWKFPNDSFGGFKFQHAARCLPNGNYLVYDNGDGVNSRPSRAVEYQLDFASKTATLVWEYRLNADKGSFRKYGGMAQRLSNGNTVITWGTPESKDPAFLDHAVTEVDPNGRIVRELKGHLLTYRIWFEETKP